MQRRNFLGTIAAVVAAPFVAKALPKQETAQPRSGFLKWKGEPGKSDVEFVELKRLPGQTMTAQEVLKIYSETGVLLFSKQMPDEEKWKMAFEVMKQRERKWLASTD